MLFKFRFAFSVYLLLFLAASHQQQKSPVPVSSVSTPEEPSEPTPALVVPKWPLSERDYTFGYWLNGLRKHADDTSADVLCLESGYGGFQLDLADFSKAKFGRLNQAHDYSEALALGAERMEKLSDAEFVIELESKGKVFRAVSSVDCFSRKKRPARDAWLWESAQVAQHYQLNSLNFEDENGVPLPSYSSLSLIMWPESLSFTAKVEPSFAYADGWHRGVQKNALCVIEKPWIVPHSDDLEPSAITVETWVKIPKKLEVLGKRTLLAKNGHFGSRGHYGFTISHGAVVANLNVAGAVETRRSIKQRGAAYKANEWNHLALSYDGKQMKFYINGVLQGTETVNKARIPGKGPLILGQRGDRFGSVARALYDQVRVWDRALSPQEVQAHAKQPQRLASLSGLRYEETFDQNDAHQVAEPQWSDVTLRIRLKGGDDEWKAERQVEGAWKLGEKKELSLQCNLNPDSFPMESISLTVSDPKEAAYPVEYRSLFDCYVAEVRKKQRDWKTGYTDIRNYDEFDLVVENSGEKSVNVPFMFYLRNPAQITGMCPILCDVEGRPTGIPVQLSKNWHYAKLKPYFRGFMQLPAAPGKSTYKLRIPYGFYGTLPSASHAQLSLVGYGGLGRWDQLAIGCWGETICFDMDMSCVDVAITDVRMLMARNGKEGNKWDWTDAGWGGDWLCVKDAKEQKLYFSEMKTAYLAHGPCLSEVHYDGNYGSQREVQVQAKVQTVRTDDYARTFQTFRYTFDQEVSAEGGWLFKAGRSHHSISPQIAYGNKDGLLFEESVPSNLRAGEPYLDRVELEGAAPWWVGFPGGYLSRGKNWGTGSRGWVIRSYRASFGGQVYTNPSISMPVLKVDKESRVNLDLLLSPPAGVTKFLPGDTIDMEIEWITLHREADDYYGPNEAYRKHLTENPRSWKTIYREALGNDLEVQVTGGSLLQRYPIVVQADDSAVRVQVKGGCGKVPIQFQGLRSATGYTLYQIIEGEAVLFDQSVHGNDFWQTDFDVKANRFQRTYNLPLDSGGSTEWLLRADMAE